MEDVIGTLSPTLSPRCREVVALRFGRSLGVEEVGDILGITHGRVSQHIARARREHPNLPRTLTNGRHRPKQQSRIA